MSKFAQGKTLSDFYAEICLRIPEVQLFKVCHRQRQAVDKGYIFLHALHGVVRAENDMVYAKNCLCALKGGF